MQVHAGAAPGEGTERRHARGGVRGVRAPWGRRVREAEAELNGARKGAARATARLSAWAPSGLRSI